MTLWFLANGGVFAFLCDMLLCFPVTSIDTSVESWRRMYLVTHSHGLVMGRPDRTSSAKRMAQKYITTKGKRAGDMQGFSNYGKCERRLTAIAV